MKNWKRILVIVVIGIFLSQLPFIVNRIRTGMLAAKISELESSRVVHDDMGYVDYKGAIHVHSFLGGHSTGTFEELIDGAVQNGLHFVVMTEHTSKNFDTSSKSLDGMHGNVLWLAGNEIGTTSGDRFLVIEGFRDLHSLGKLKTGEMLGRVKAKGSAAFVTYPERFASWGEEIDGVEVFSLNSNARKMNPFLFLLDAAWSYRAYPELTLARYFARPDGELELFDSLSRKRKISLFGGNDAHSNIGIHFGDNANHKVIDLKYDKYSTIFRLVRTHILLGKDELMTKENVLLRLKQGNSFIGFDVLGDTSGFRFYASNGIVNAIMGDELVLGQDEWSMHAHSPLPARFVLIKDGVGILESAETESIKFLPSSKGTYRVEVFLDALGPPFDKMPWIISNPIYVR